MPGSGADLARLLLGSYRTLIDDAMTELAARGHPAARPTHYVVLTAIAAGVDNASELGRRLSVSKQAAAKTITVLLEHGYVGRDADPRDPRRKRIEITAAGIEVLRDTEAIFDELRGHWEARIGARELAVLEAQLTDLAAEPVSPRADDRVAPDPHGTD